MNVLGVLTKYQGNKRVLKYSQSVGDIITGILQTNKLYHKDYDNICMMFFMNIYIKIFVKSPPLSTII